MFASTIQEEFDDLLIRWLELEELCYDDVNGILNFLDRNGSRQELRRAFIRASWGYIEAVIGGLHGIADFANKHEPENYPKIGHRETTCNRVKFVLKVSCKLLCLDWSPDFGGSGWMRFQDSNRKRDALMHPKNPRDLDIDDADMEIAKGAIVWLMQTTGEMKQRMIARGAN